MADTEDYEANKVAVEDICREPANSECADCGANGTRWATVNHGCFVCIRCSGIHRSLGTHISKVKSTNLDKWTSAEVAVMKMVGNKNGRALFEGRLPPKGEKPAPEESDSVVREFITKKYDDKKYAAPDWVPALKRVFKAAGYKAGKKALKELPADKQGGGADAAATGADAAVAEVGKKSKKDKKKGAVVGVFGGVTVAEDVHDSRLAAVLLAFGLGGESDAAPAAEAEAAATATATEETAAPAASTERAAAATAETAATADDEKAQPEAAAEAAPADAEASE